MAGVREKRAREIQETIREVLYQEWDPFAVRGLAPRDEYDSYIGGVYRILVSSRSEDALVEFLGQTADLGVPGCGPDHLRSVACRLLALDVRL